MDVLIVENESSIVLDLKKFLRNLGHNVVAVASTGEEAILKAGDLNPDLVLINIKLKGEMKGVDAARKIVSLYKIPIIYLSVFYKNCLNKSLELTEDAIILSEPIMQEHLEYCISKAFF
ncbi:MAG: response regulator [Methanobacterium sp.]